MARKFWERLSGSRIQFYKDPLDLRIEDVDAKILEIQTILALDDSVKALIAAGNPALTEAQFNEAFEDELAEIADQRDYFDNSNVTIQEVIDVIDFRWMSPADMSLAPGVIVSFCGEEVANPAINAIDGVAGQNWQHDVDEIHELVIDLGYRKRIDGIRIKNTASPGNPLLLSGVQVFVANGINGLDNPANQVGVDLTFLDPNDNDRTLTTKTGRYIKIQIGSTAHGSNHITIRDIEFRTRPRTFGL